jgi:ribonuclease HI
MKESNSGMEIQVYTDGSCHTQKRNGAWAAILLLNERKIVLQGTEMNTTNNRMELMAVIKAIEYICNNMGSKIVIQLFTDSQYVLNVPSRSVKLMERNYISKGGKELKNTDLLKIWIKLFKTSQVRLNKVKAHQQVSVGINYNVEADKLARKMVRAM